MTTGNERNTRRLQSWIEGFLEYTAGLPSPEIYRRWTAVVTVAGALERRVFTRNALGILYPNLFTVLVGHPAVGKSVIIDEARKFWAGTGVLHTAPKTMTHKGFIDELLASKRDDIDIEKNSYEAIHFMVIGSTEFGNLIPDHNLPFLNTMNDIYDCPPIFDERLRSQDKRLQIDNPGMTLLAGTQPAYLGELFPEAAFGMGYTSRTIMVWAAGQPPVSIFHGPQKSEELHEKLASDLKLIAKLHGSMTWTPEAIASIEAWNKGGREPVPQHPKLIHYAGRRIANVMKISMAMSAAESDSLVIEDRHFKEARDLLLQTEENMMEIFKEMTKSSHKDILEEAWYFLWRRYNATNKKPIPENLLVEFLAHRQASNMIEYTIRAMENAGWITRSGQAPTRFVYPQMKTET